MTKARKYVVKRRFEGLPKREDFDIVEYELPSLKADEILLKAEWISVDPYLRAYSHLFQIPYDQFGMQVGTVQESNNSKYPVGTKLVTNQGWCDLSVIDADKQNLLPFTPMYKAPAIRGLCHSHCIGALGAIGTSAYYGFLELCAPKAGETVVVTGAAGAVGSLVGQIAKIKGCRVIGFAGSDDKVQWLEKELGFDKALNYKTVDATKALKKAAPNGVDCYFDNVAGELSSIIMNQMNDFGRVAVCGSISAYNDDPSKISKATIIQPALVFKQLRVEGFLSTRWDAEKRMIAWNEIMNWMLAGKLIVKEHITEGFDNLFDAFRGMLVGENMGRAIVKV